VKIDTAVVKAAMRRHRIPNYQSLADLLCVSYSTIKRQVTGKDAPSPTVLGGLHCRLGVSTDKVLIFIDPHVQDMAA